MPCSAETRTSCRADGADASVSSASTDRSFASVEQVAATSPYGGRVGPEELAGHRSSDAVNTNTASDLVRSHDSVVTSVPANVRSSGNYLKVAADGASESEPPSDSKTNTGASTPHFEEVSHVTLAGHTHTLVDVHGYVNKDFDSHVSPVPVDAGSTGHSATGPHPATPSPRDDSTIGRGVSIPSPSSPAAHTHADRACPSPSGRSSDTSTPAHFHDQLHDEAIGEVAGAIRRTPKGTTRMIALLSLAAAIAANAVPPNNFFGYVNGYQCGQGSACYTQPTVTLCLLCCSQWCSYGGFLAECQTGCAPNMPGGKGGNTPESVVVASVAQVAAEIQSGKLSGDVLVKSVDFLVMACNDGDENVAKFARLVASETPLVSSMVAHSEQGKGI